MDDVTLRIGAEVSSALREITKLRAEYLAFTAKFEDSTRSVQKAVDQLSGDRAIRAAQSWVQTVQQLGGVTNLTQREQAQLNKILDEAIQKYAAMGKTAPQAMHDLRAATQGAAEGMKSADGFTNQFFLRLAGGQSIAYIAAKAVIGAFHMIEDGIKGAVAFVGELIERGSKVENITRSFQGLAKGIGQVSDEILNKGRTASKGMISDFDLMAAANKAMLFGLQVTPERFSTLTEASIKLGRAMNMDASKALNDLTVALGRTSPRILDNLGIIVKVSDATREWAAAHHTTTRNMTAEQRTLAFEEMALRKIAEKSKDLSDLQLTLADRLQIVNIQFDNWLNKLGFAINRSPVIRKMFEEIGKFVDYAFGQHSADLINFIVKLIENVAIVVVDVASVLLKAGATMRGVWNAQLLVMNTVQLAMYATAEAFANAHTKMFEIAALVPGVGGAFSAAAAKTKEWSAALGEHRKEQQADIAANLAAINQTDELGVGMRQTGKFLDDLSGKLKEASKQRRDDTIAISENIKVHRPLNDEIENNINATKVLTSQKETLEKALIRLNAQLEGAYAAHMSDAEIAKVHGTAIKNLTTRAEELNVSLVHFAAVQRGLQSVQAAAFAKVVADVNFRNAIEMGKYWKDRKEELEKNLHESAEAWLNNQKLITSTHLETNKILGRMDKDSLQLQLNNIKEEADARRAKVAERQGNTKQALDQIDAWEKASADQAYFAWQDHVNKVKALMPTFENAFRDVLKKIPGLITSALTGGGGWGKAFEAITASLSTNLGKAIFGIDSVSRVIQKTLLGTLGQISPRIGAALAGSMSTLVPGIGAAIGAVMPALIGKIAGLFKTPEWKRVMKDVGNRWGTDISEELAKKIAEDTKKLGDRSAAELLHLSDIIKEAGGVTIGNITKWTGAADQLITKVQQGHIKVGDAVKQLDEIFPQLASTISKTDGIATDSMLALIAHTKEAGLQVASVTEFLEAQATKLTGSFSTIAKAFAAPFQKAIAVTEDADGAGQKLYERYQIVVASIKDLQAKSGDLTEKQKVQLEQLQAEFLKLSYQLGKSREDFKMNDEMLTQLLDRGQEGFERMGRLAVVAFETATANGKTLIQTMSEMGDGLDALISLQSTFGFTAEGAFASLLQIRGFIKDNQELADSIDAVNQMTIALHNLNALNQDSFEDLAHVAKDTYQKILDTGTDGSNAMRLMQPTLQTIWEMQRKYNYSVDEGTQALLDEAEASGVVGKQHMSDSAAMREASERMVTVLELIAQRMGVDIPNASGKMGQAVIRTTDDWRKRLAGVHSDLEQVRDDVDGITFGSSPGGLKEWMPMLAKARGSFRDFSKSAISDLDNLRGTVDDFSLGGVSGPMGASGGSTASQEIHLHIHGKDDREIATQVVKVTQEALNERRITVPNGVVLSVGERSY